MRKSDSISVIICTRNRPKELARLWESLDRQTRLPDEVVVVDSSEGKETEGFVAEKTGKLSYAAHYIHSKPGLTLQKNIGVAGATGDLLFFLDDDLVLEPMFIEAMLRTFLADSKIVGVTGRITNLASDRWLDRVIKRMFFLIDHGSGRFKLSGLPSHRVDDQFSDVEVCSGGCSAFRRTVFGEFLFDERLTGYSYMEDVDFSYRVSRKFRLAYQPLARSEHLSGTSSRTDSGVRRKMFIRNHIYLFLKNAPKDFAHLYGFAASLIGMLVYNAVINRNLRSCVGILGGMVESVRAKGNPE